MKTTILVVDDHPMFRDALCMTLNNFPDINVVGVATNGIQAVNLAEQLKPDIVCLDINMTGLNGIDTTTKLLKQQSAIKVIALSAHLEHTQLAKLMNAGAMGYVEKSCVGNELLNAINSVKKNEKYFGSVSGL
jgi:DNA-binding NarL/FixJ family response regulator